MDTRNRITVGYTRVSTLDQASEGISLDMQAEKIRAMACVKNIVINKVFCDAGASAKDIKHRPELTQLLDLVKSDAVSCVIVYKLDRLTRSVRDLAELLDVFDAYKVDLVSISESLDTSTATGRLMLNLLVSVAQWEREVIGERTKDALNELKTQGKAYTFTPYGKSKNDAKEFEINPDEQATIDRILAMRQDGESLHEIANQLNLEGVLTKTGKAWQATQVMRIIRRVA